MVLKNSMMPTDPESPQRNVFNNFKNSAQNDDPWYSNNSPAASPHGESKGNFNFGGYESNNNSGTSMFNDLSSGGYSNNSGAEEDYDNEPPLLEELGIRFDHMWSKTQAVMYPFKPLSEHILDDADLAGPVFFCLLLGACLLLSGKIQFGYIYGFSVFGCLGMNGIINLMHPTGLDFWRTCSVLGYCLIPVIGLAAVSIILRLKNFFGVILAIAAIGWATQAASRMFEAKLGMTEQFYLIAYPTMLLYSCFVLITIF